MAIEIELNKTSNNDHDPRSLRALSKESVLLNCDGQAVPTVGL